MPAPNQAQALQKTDEELFSAGACHVFAKILTEEFSDEGYELWCMEAEQWTHSPKSGEKRFSDRRLVHVFAKRGSIIIDVHGVQEEASYRRTYEEAHCTHSGISTYFDKTFTRPCSLKELFSPELAELEAGTMSQDRLYLDEDFILEAELRAKSLIAANREKYVAA